MDRATVYAGSIPQDVDLLSTNKNAMVGLGWALQAVLGTGTCVDGLACTPNSPAALNVLVGPGAIYALQNTDASAYGSLAADTTHQLVKQGLSLDTATLACPAPATTGQSVVYLVQAAYLDSDSGPVVLPYYNAANPAVAYSGPANSGVAQNTVRKGVCQVSVKTGVAATTGTQTTPAPDAGYTGLYAVTVANGQTTITSGNIAALSTAPFIGPKLTGVRAQIQGGADNYAADTSGAANTITVALTPAPALGAGMPLRVKVANTNTGAVVINANGLGNVAVKTPDGNALPPAALRATSVYTFAHDGTYWVLQTPPANTAAVGFAATSSTSQVMTAATWVKMQFNVEDFDPYGLFDSATNYRFAPTTAGKYLVNVIAALSAINTGKVWTVAVYKNGSLLKQATNMSNGGVPSAGLTALVDLNGTSDYLEFYGYNGDVSNQTLNSGPTFSQASAVRVTF